MDSLDEVLEYPQMEVRVGEGEWRETAPTRAPHRADTALLDLDEFESVLDEEGNLKASADSPDGEVAELDAEGVRIEREGGDVQVTSDDWVEETLRSMVDEEEAERLRSRRTEREEREAQVEELRERMEEIAEEEAKNKKKKRKGK